MPRRRTTSSRWLSCVSPPSMPLPAAPAVMRRLPTWPPHCAHAPHLITLHPHGRRRLAAMAHLCMKSRGPSARMGMSVSHDGS
jgi:hypothetical protein